METTPLVSVITCFYNEERFLEETIKSVLGQTLPAWELILVDDGSSDGSTSLARDYAHRYPGRIFYLEHEQHSNRGLSASRNHGIKIARGEFIAYLDADDVWLPEKLENQVAIFRNQPQATVLLEASNYWYSWENVPSKFIDTVIPIGSGQDKLYPPPALIPELYPLGKGAAPCPSGIMVRKEVHDRISFEESYRGIYQMYEDQAFLSKVYLHEHVYVSPLCHNLYRQRAASLVSSVHSSGKYDNVRRYYLEWFQQYLRTSGVNISIVNKLLKKALRPYHQPVRFFIFTTVPLSIRDRISTLILKVRKKIKV